MAFYRHFLSFQQVLTVVLITLLCANQVLSSSQIELSQHEQDAILDLISSIPDLTTLYHWDSKSVGQLCHSGTPWKGIQCENGRVVSLEIVNPSVCGKVPKSISNLSSLRVINLSGLKSKVVIDPSIFSIASLNSLTLPNQRQTDVVHVQKKESLDCIGASPGPNFRCVADSWTFFNLTVASGSFIDVPSDGLRFSGSLFMDTSSKLMINGLQGPLIVTECARIYSDVSFSLSQNDVTSIRKTKSKTPIFESDCQPSKKLEITIASAPRTCQQYYATMTQSQLANGRWVAFAKWHVDSIRCHIWWIVLLGFIFGALLFILLFYGVSKLLTKPHRPAVAIYEEDQYDL